MLKKKKPNTVTRFINKKNYFNKKNNTVSSAIFISNSNKKMGEISVFNIDEELKNNEQEKIFIIGDTKVFKNSSTPTPARADLLVSEIENIKLDNKNLFVETPIFGKHCNIKPFPKDDIKATNIALKLAQISSLRIRGYKSL